MFKIVRCVHHHLACWTDVTAAVCTQVIAAVEFRETGHFTGWWVWMPFGFLPSESIFTEHDSEFWNIFGGFNDGFESAGWVGVIRFVIHHTRLNVIFSALYVHEIISG